MSRNVSNQHGNLVREVDRRRLHASWDLWCGRDRRAQRSSGPESTLVAPCGFNAKTLLLAEHPSQLPRSDYDCICNFILGHRYCERQSGRRREGCSRSLISRDTQALYALGQHDLCEVQLELRDLLYFAYKSKRHAQHRDFHREQLCKLPYAFIARHRDTSRSSDIRANIHVDAVVCGAGSCTVAVQTEPEDPRPSTQPAAGR